MIPVVPLFGTQH